MKIRKGISRRKFIANSAIAGIGTIGSAGILASCSSENINSSEKYRPEERHFNGMYSGNCLDRIAFPVGGIGAGMYCIEGSGALSHMSVHNHPDVFNEPCVFAAISVKGLQNKTRVIEGPVPGWKKFGRPDTANGSGGTTYGLPRFREASFVTKFPFAHIILSDAEMPVKAELSAWSPFIPTDEDSSSLPAGILEYSITNLEKTPVEAVFSYNARNFMQVAGGKNSVKSIEGGFILSENGIKDKPGSSGDFAIFSDEDGVIVDNCWFRGGWFDPMTITWETIMKGETRKKEPVEGDAPGASLYIPFKMNAGETKTIKLFTVWFAPDSDLRYGEEPKEKREMETCGPSCSCHDKYYKPWYSSKFRDIFDVSSYVKKNYADLRSRSLLFSDSFYKSTLPPEVIEAIAANLAIIKSPTVLRQTDGRLWSWEGCGDNSGCCAGSCTHVWNYAQAIPNLFPRLERTLRETEFFASQDKEGHQTFRSALPVRPVASNFYAASDGQLGGIMKVYREWRISGDTGWMKKMFPKVKGSIDYCIATWDPDRTGTLKEPHHNTYDIEFWGADGMCTSFYLGALKAIIAMGSTLGEEVEKYQVVYEAGKQAFENDLFNGEYFIQKIQWKGLKAEDPVAASSGAWNVNYSDEAKELLIKEGPKYQYGKGCLSDGVLGLWIGAMCGLDDIADRSKVLSHLLSVYKSTSGKICQNIRTLRDQLMLLAMKAGFSSAPGQKERCCPCHLFTVMKYGQALNTR